MGLGRVGESSAQTPEQGTARRKPRFNGRFDSLAEVRSVPAQTIEVSDYEQVRIAVDTKLGEDFHFSCLLAVLF